MTETRLSVNREICFAGRGARLRKATRDHTCREHRGLIVKGETYWHVVLYNAGLAGVKFPLRVCVHCYDKFKARVTEEEKKHSEVLA